MKTIKSASGRNYDDSSQRNRCLSCNFGACFAFYRRCYPAKHAQGADCRNGTLVSATVERSGEKIESFGPNPLGYMMFSPDGHFSVNFVHPDRQLYASNNRETGTPEENRTAVQGNISAFGTYKLDPDGSLIFQIVGSNFPNWNGTTQKRLVEISGNQLKYITPATSIGGLAVSILIRASPMR
jgi:hypothetical protein